MKNENWIKLEFGPSERKCVCGKCPNGKNMDLAEVFKVFDVTLVYSRKNENGGFNETIVRAGVLARNFEDINDVVKKQIIQHIAEGAQLVSATIKSV